jgi:hypothetical protein
MLPPTPFVSAATRVLFALFLATSFACNIKTAAAAT